MSVLEEMLRRIGELRDLAHDVRAHLASGGPSGNPHPAVPSAEPARACPGSAEWPADADDVPAGYPPVVVPTMPGGPGRARLTRRQQEVLGLLSFGMSNRRISRQLAITEQTVKAHLHMIYHKLGAGDRTEAVVIAFKDGLVSPGPAASPQPPAVPLPRSGRPLPPPPETPAAIRGGVVPAPRMRRTEPGAPAHDDRSHHHGDASRVHLHTGRVQDS